MTGVGDNTLFLVLPTKAPRRRGGEFGLRSGPKESVGRAPLSAMLGLSFPFPKIATNGVCELSCTECPIPERHDPRTSLILTQLGIRGIKGSPVSV